MCSDAASLTIDQYDSKASQEFTFKRRDFSGKVRGILMERRGQGASVV